MRSRCRFNHNNDFDVFAYVCPRFSQPLIVLPSCRSSSQFFMNRAPFLSPFISAQPIYVVAEAEEEREELSTINDDVC